MELEIFQFTTDDGWSIKSFPKLDSDNTLILIFCGSDYIANSMPITELARHYPKSKIIGCSSAGEIIGANIFDKSISVAILHFTKTIIKIVKEEITNTDDSFNAGKAIATRLACDDLRGIFVLSDGLQINGSELVKGLNANNNKNVVITGGLAGDGNRFKTTWVIYQGVIYSNSVVAVGLYGEHIRIGHASRGGWDPFGPERNITRSKNNILYELNEQPALQLYKKLLGDQAIYLPASGLFFPLAIRKNEDTKKSLVRTILQINESEQSLIFAGDMPMGYLAQLMRANFDRLIVSASEAGEVVTKIITDVSDKKMKTVLTVAISCVGRRLLLGERTEEETESVLDSMPAGVKQIGFYSYGEISPYADGTCDLHNQTMTLTLFYED